MTMAVRCFNCFPPNNKNFILNDNRRSLDCRSRCQRRLSESGNYTINQTIQVSNLYILSRLFSAVIEYRWGRVDRAPIVNQVALSNLCMVIHSKCLHGQLSRYFVDHCSQFDARTNLLFLRIDANFKERLLTLMHL